MLLQISSESTKIVNMVNIRQIYEQEFGVLLLFFVSGCTVMSVCYLVAADSICVSLFVSTSL